jgi:hypothetical protein
MFFLREIGTKKMIVKSVLVVSGAKQKNQGVQNAKIIEILVKILKFQAPPHIHTAPQLHGGREEWNHWG